MRKYYRWIVLGILAFTVGTLFRLADLSGVALFRMFGFLGVVLIGVILTWMITTWQMRSGRHELYDKLTSIPGAKLYQVPGKVPVPTLRSEAVVEREGTYYIVASTTLPNFRARRYRRRLQSAIVGFGHFGNTDDGFPLRHVLVLLRRRVRDDELRFAREHGVTLVNPDSLADQLM